MWEDISEAPTQGIRCAAVRRTVERAHTIRRTAAKTEKTLLQPERNEDRSPTQALDRRAW
ncbi:hypothetical protein GCM10011577_35680 [Pseudarthrobacter polychromogenes]|uniref:Uncharacterized protein n=1 Tax=Pseudarthrobacter polychromogenes TaxID=1676 RepID=A0ABQ1Y0M6_9MICC|nr:hypothetical protein GCM10011577_35680 [Pseudarthrobacter polychromogenes]